MEYSIKEKQIEAVLTSVNLESTIEGGRVDVVIGDAAKMEVAEALNYIKSGQAEIKEAVSEVEAEITAHAEEKTAEFDANALNKTNAFNQNATDKTTAFNNNATSKTADFNTNASNKTSDFNTNATNKTTAFNENYTEKKAVIDSQVELAKDWATKTDGTVDGTDYSAKYYAQSILPYASDITTVAGIASDVTTVSSISSDVTSVAGNATDISTVADNISDVNSVATDILKVTAVADDLTNINAVNANKTNIDAVAGNNSNITAVANNATNINAVAGNATNINAVNANKANIDTVAGINADISTVATNISDVSSVATDISNVNAVASDLTNIDAVNSNKTNIDAVAGDLTNINAVAGDLTNIDNASSYANLAKDWATKTTGTVDGSEYSAKHYAEQAESELSGLSSRVTTIEGIIPSSASSSNQLTDKDYVDTQDNALQSQIDALVVSSDVFDIVGTYAELQAYDISTVPVNDIIKVLVDSTHSNAATYYRCVESGGVKSWSYIGSEGAYYTKAETNSLLDDKQDTLVSGTNIKTVNGNSLLGSGDVSISDTATWGNITGTLSNQTDLNNALNAKQGTISDLSTIRSGAALGATAVQPSSLAIVATSGDYNDLSNKPTVDQTYDGTSANAQSGVAVASAISGKANDSDVVKLSGNQNIGGQKTFTSNPISVKTTAAGTNPYGTFYSCRENNLENNTNPSVNKVYYPLVIFDKRAGFMSWLEFYKNTDGSSELSINARARNTADTGNISSKLGVMAKRDGTIYSYAPKPTEDTTSSIQIDTVGARNTKLAGYQTALANATGYDSTQTQTLKNINGVLTWVTD